MIVVACVYIHRFRGNRTICRRFVNAAIAGFSLLFLLLHRDDDNGIFILSFFILSFSLSLSLYLFFIILCILAGIAGRIAFWQIPRDHG